jgi:hypothetical protein
MQPKKKQVSFALQQTAYFSNPHREALQPEERKALCWYSDAELSPSREDARRAIQALQKQLDILQQQGEDGEDTHSKASVDALVIQCPEDPSQILCLRGIEKYADAAAKYAGQKRLVGSVLRQQSINKRDDHLVALVSQTLSQPFKDVARYYAVKSAEEQEALRKQEEEERKSVTTAVLLLLVEQQQQQQQHHNEGDPSKDGAVHKRAQPQHHQERVSKRARDAPFYHDQDTCLHRRNVKPCVRVISE